jgi:hypothetical protein
MCDYIRMGYWLVLPYHAVRHYANLRISPAGVVPQRERRPRPIMDYSYSGVNQDSFPIQPHQSMQFGSTLQRLLQRLVYCNPFHGPPLLAKLDLADGYYRVPLSPAAALQLAVVIPNDLPGPHLVAIPLTLPMGWSHSPPYFCAYTETIADMANATYGDHHPPHPLLDASQTSSTSLPPTPNQFHPSAIVLGSENTQPLAFHDVYIDDFITIAQPPRHTTALNTLLHAIDSVFTDSNHSIRRPIISRSKLDKGDAVFSTSKRVLGWDIDTSTMCLALPQHRLDNLTSIINTFLAKNRTSRRSWQQLLGVLRSSSPALYGAAHLFSILQHTLTTSRAKRIRLPQLSKRVLQDWLHLATQAHDQPVPLHTLVPQPPHIVAATDASLQGMGGFWCDATKQNNYVWRAQFPPNVQQAVVSQQNPTGIVSNSALELAAIIVGSHMAAKNPTYPHPHMLIASDNTAACGWMQKGSTTSTQSQAFLLHHLTRLRRDAPFSFTCLYASGCSNTLADCCSRLFSLPDTEFLQYVNMHYPVQPSWTLVTPPNDLLSNVNSAILNKLHTVVLPLVEPTPPTRTGTCGSPSVSTFTATPTCPNFKTQSRSYKYLHTDIEMAPWLPAALQSALAQWRTPFVPWDRRLPHWAAPIPGCNLLGN